MVLRRLGRRILISSMDIRPTRQLYFDDAYQWESEARILSVSSTGPISKDFDKPEASSNNCSTIVLDQTLFYPQGGGQPCDVGIITDKERTISFQVQQVRSDKDTGIIYHNGIFEKNADSDIESGFPSTFKTGMQIFLYIDKDRRLLHSRLHSAGHLIDAILKCLNLISETDGLVASKGHHFPDGPFVEYTGLDKLNETQLAQLTDLPLLQKMADEFVEADTPIVAHISTSDVESSSPASIYRTVTIAGHTCACGGTHVKSTKELHKVLVKRVKLQKKDNSCKVSYDVKSSQKSSSSTLESR